MPRRERHVEIPRAIPRARLPRYAVFEAGDIGFYPITAIRAVADAAARRRAAYLETESKILAAARDTDPRPDGQILKWWSDAVDATDNDADPDADADADAEADAFDHSDTDSTDPDSGSAAQHRADALIDAVRAAAASDLTSGARNSAKVTLAVPADRCAGPCDIGPRPEPNSDASTATDDASHHASNTDSPGPTQQPGHRPTTTHNANDKRDSSTANHRVSASDHSRR